MSRQEESFVVYRTPKLIPVPPDANRDSSIIKLAVNLDAELWPKFVKDNRVEKKTQFVKFDQVFCYWSFIHLLNKKLIF